MGGLKRKNNDKARFVKKKTYILVCGKADNVCGIADNVCGKADNVSGKDANIVNMIPLQKRCF